MRLVQTPVRFAVILISWRILPTAMGTAPGGCEEGYYLRFTYAAGFAAIHRFAFLAIKFPPKDPIQ